MGKASRWFRNILGLKRPDPKPNTNPPTAPNQKRRWGFVKSSRENQATPLATKRTQQYSSYGPRQHQQQRESGFEEEEEEDPEKHAISVAVATAAVAEAAVAAAQAAAAVVRLTSSSAQFSYNHKNYSLAREGEELAAIKIQSAFRGYLARRALRALKGLVRLQALVRGHIERKRTAEWLRRMQALLRAQARARAGRAIVSESSQSSSKSSHFHHHGPQTPEKFEHARSKSTKYEQSPMLKRNGSKSNVRIVYDSDKEHVGCNLSERRMDEQSWNHRVPSARIGTIYDEKNDKILEIDTGKHHFVPKRRNLSHSSRLLLASDQYSHSFATSKDSTTHQAMPSTSSAEVQSLSPLKFSHDAEESPFCTADNSPQFYSASSRRGNCNRSPFTPTKSDGSRSYLSGYSDHPNYMAYTESSKAKLRSLSALRQRPQYERCSSAKSFSVYGFGESRSQKVISQHVNFTSKAYPGSGRLDKLGMPVGVRY